jgi:KRAB domain-containing zinc finger protein
MMSVEDRARMAQDAKKQFFALGGRRLSKEIKSTRMNGEIEEVILDSEDWQYEFLDEVSETIFAKDTLTCDYCSLNNFKSKDQLLEHFKKLHCRKLTSSHVCDIKDCVKRFSAAYLLRAHKRTYHGLRVSEKSPKAYVCDLCEKKFYSRSSILTHLLVTHKKIADFCCKHCNKNFKSSGNLVRHVKAVHEDKKTMKFTCEKCGRMFRERYQLEIHIHNHDATTKCKLCGRKVANLRVHLRHHASKANNIQVKCPHCNKIIKKYQLPRHIKNVHERQYNQKDTSSTNASLKIYICGVCDEHFSRLQHLRQHEYINHTTSKLFECAECGTIFNKLKLLNLHQLTHNPLNLRCELCSNVYARKGALQKHQKKHHPE